MSIKSKIKQKLVNVVRTAVREEMQDYQALSLSTREDAIVKKLDKSVERWTWERYKRIDKQIEWWTWERFKRADKQIEWWTWERYKRSRYNLSYVYKLQNEISHVLYQLNQVPYHTGEKIRIVFLFQVASFWPSWESFYQACLDDDRMDVRLLFLDETNTETVQMVTARTFLEESKIEYIPFEEFDLGSFNPHVMVIQTPYDNGHRIKAHWSAAWKAKGYRLVYIPYGIEISDTDKSHNMHFEQHVPENVWRLFTFNELLLKDYRKYCVNATAVRTLGLPKFDSLYHKENFPLDPALQERIAGRPVCLWKVHFPKMFWVDGVEVCVTPDIHEYIKFAEYAASRPDVFFIFMPHPRFREPVGEDELTELACQLVETLTDKENVYIDFEDDYRYSLMNADYIIVDRSAVMVEAAALGVPVLYMSSEEYYEPLTKGVEGIVESFYQGHNCEDMTVFLNNCLQGIDEKKAEREAAFARDYPYFDGNAGERIKDHIIESIYQELPDDGQLPAE